MRNDGGGEEGQEGSGDGLGDCGFEVQIQWLVIEEVENAVGDANDSTVWEDKSEKGIEEMKEERVVFIIWVCCRRIIIRIRDNVGIEMVEEVGEGGRE